MWFRATNYNVKGVLGDYATQGSDGDMNSNVGFSITSDKKDEIGL